MAASAAALVERAEQKLKGGGFMSFLTGGPKYDEAQELYQQAANQYKIGKEWQQAASCYEQCAFCAEKSGSASDQANFHMEAGNVLKRISAESAAEQFEKSLAIYSASGRFQQCGKLLMGLAETFEAERLDVKRAKDYYKRAAEMFELDDHSKSNFSKCQLKLAEMAAKDGDLQQAITIFESEGEKALQNNLLQYSAKDHFLKAGILHLAMGDSVTANLAVEKYNTLDPRFAASREGELIGGLAEAFEAGDVEKFLDVLHEYDRISKLDAWKTEFLLKVKEAMAPSASGGGIEDLT
jgi:alpha-soluble NSF attachment protein